MNILVIGCGKTGAQLCNQLNLEGHDVSVIDPNIANFTGLSEDFSGYTVSGVPIDQDVLRRAGVEACDVIAAVTEDDNMNLMVCQLAQELFQVPRVLARLYDPRRSEMFRQFGIQTICPINLSVAAICSMLLENDHLKNIQMDSASVSFDAMPAPESAWERPLGELCADNNQVIGLFGVLHTNGTFLLAHAGSDYVLDRHDRLVYAKVVD